MRTRIRMWGNSLGVRIPRPLAIEARIETGSEVDISVKSGKLVIESLTPEIYDLDELLARMTPVKRHDEIETGDGIGQEAW
jgi:antitoxin MazE